MKKRKTMELLPDPNVVFTVPNVKTVTYVKPTIKNKNIIVGDFTYFSDVDFESHVTHFYPDFYNDKLIICKFCQIASNVEPYSIAAGNPARFIRKRFDDELIELMLELK